MFLFLTVLQAIVAAALVGVILMQRSEGGGLGIGGSPTGMFSARGAADFMSRMTKWLAVVFVALSITMAVVATSQSGTASIDSTLDRSVTPAAPVDPLGAANSPLGAPDPAATAGPAGAAPAAPASDPLADTSN